MGGRRWEVVRLLVKGLAAGGRVGMLLEVSRWTGWNQRSVWRFNSRGDIWKFILCYRFWVARVAEVGLAVIMALLGLVAGAAAAVQSS